MPDRGVSAVKNEGARVLDIVRSGCVRHEGEDEIFLSLSLITENFEFSFLRMNVSRFQPKIEFSIIFKNGFLVFLFIYLYKTGVVATWCCGYIHTCRMHSTLVLLSCRSSQKNLISELYYFLFTMKVPYAHMCVCTSSMHISSFFKYYIIHSCTTLEYVG